jgi:hypothetical protein
MGTCPKCGKTVSLRELSKSYGRCQDCFQKECSEYEYWKARQLSSPADCQMKGLGREMNKENESVPIILDFSSLRDVMTRTGITMTKIECPNCNGAVEIPEAGNIIICQYCRTPIRPNEVFKKISLI